MEKIVFNHIEETLNLKLAEKYILNAGRKVLHLKEGNLNLFFRYKSPDGKENRRFFINSFEAPCFIQVPEIERIKDLILAAVTDCSVDVVSESELQKVPKKNSEEILKLTDKSVLAGIDGLVKFKPQSLPVPFTLNAENTSSANGHLINSRINDVKWIVANSKLMLFDKFPFAENSVLPLTSKIWYGVEKGVQFKVLSTQEMFQENKGLLVELLNFWTIFNDIGSLFYKESVGDSIRQVYTNIETAKGHWKYSHDKLFSIINPLEKDEKVFTESDALFGCLELIGKYEKINFSKAGFKNELYSPLDNILRSSKVRSRQVRLKGEWYKKNQGAFLAYTKDGDSPVALIPKGEKQYKAVFYEQKAVELVSPEIAEQLQEKAEMFFAPFPDGELTGKKMISFGLQYIKKDLAYFFAIGSVVALIALLVPVLTGYLFDNVIPNSNISELGQIFIVLLTIVISMGILSFAQSISVLRLEGTLNYKLQSAIWDRLLSLKVQFFQKYSAGDLAERSMGIEKIRGVLSGAVLTALISFIFSLFYLALLFYYDTKLALIGLALGLVIVAFTIFMSYFGFKHVMVIRHLEVILSGFLFQLINGVNKIRVTDSKERAFSQWVGRYYIQKKHYAGKRKINVAGEVFGAVFPIFSAIFIFMKVHQLLYSGDGDFTVGNYISFNNAFICFQGALLQMSMATVPLLTIKPIYNMFKPIIEAETEHNEESKDPGELKGEISVSNLSFKYEEGQPLILDDISFTIHEGEYVALVGSSGSGKSTLLRLLLGFESPSSGQVNFDHQNLSKIDIRSVRSQIGVVLQNGSLMQGSVLYNIIGNTTLTEEDAWDAARRAGCADEIEKLPEKMHTQINSGDSLLSGGQIQRIIIAKALVKNPKILFFDEATSALDNVTQRVVTDSIDQLDATRIVIAHRLSTIMNANRIIVLDKGKLIEQGTYEELLAKDGFFAELAKRQFV